MKLMKKILLALILITTGITLFAQNEMYSHEEFMSTEGKELKYRLLRPEVEKEGEKYPLVIFMHGAGERGDDNEKQLVHGSRMFLNPVNREKYPAYVIFPQCPEEEFWAYGKDSHPYLKLKEESDLPPSYKAVKELIDSYLATPHIDRSRVYILGLSMGGMATFDMVARYPEIFAAAIPICGAIDVTRLSDVEGVRFRIYHGDADDDVPVECSRAAYKALKKAGVDVEYIEFPGCGHNSWNPAFNQPDFMEWLFKQKKSRKYLK